MLEENSDDEPSLFKAFLTLICHMQSLCVRLKIVFQFCVPGHKSYHTLHPNHWRDIPLQVRSAALGIWTDSREHNYPVSQFIDFLVSWSVTKIIVHSPGLLCAGISYTSGKKMCFNTRVAFHLD